MSPRRTLPAGWRWVRFGDVVRQVKDRIDPDSGKVDRVVTGGDMVTDQLRIASWGTVGDGYLGPAFHRHFRSGHVLYGSRRTYLRKVAVPDFEGVCANTTFVLESATEELRQDFLPLVMSHDRFHDHSVQQSKGSVNPYVNFSDLAWYEFPLPPINEQGAIVARFQAATDALDRHERVGPELDQLAEALFAAATEGADWLPLGEVLLESPRNGFTIAPSPQETGAWSLTVASASFSGYCAGGKKPIEPPGDDKFLARPGDLFVTRSNTIDLVGLPIRVPPGEPLSLFYSDLLMRLRTDESIVPPQLLERYLRTVRARRFIQSIAAGTSASMKKVNGRNLKTLPVPVLQPTVRARLLEDLESLTAAQVRVGDHLQATRALRRAILSEALDV